MSSAPSSLLNTTTAVFPPSADVGSVARILEETFIRAGGEPDTLTLDFSHSRFIEIATLQLTIALITDRRRRGRTTQLHLPIEERVRHFLRRWNYAGAVKLASGIPFSALVCPDDLRYFRGRGGDQGEPVYLGAHRRYDLGRHGQAIEQLESRRFFEFMTWDVRRYDDVKRLVVDERDRWRGPLILSVLENLLDRRGEYVASRIVFEAMTNAVRHPGASTIQAVSHNYMIDEMSGFFTLVYWDDGKSMLDTLRCVMHRGERVRDTITTSDFDCTFLLVPGNERAPMVVNSAILPNSMNSDEEILLATICPGVTSDVNRETFIPNPDLDQRLASPGMGLFVLVNTAVDVFRGSVAFRTDRYFMNIKALSANEARRYDAKYRAKIIRYGDAKPPFLGNMVTIRLPLRRETD